MPAFPASLPSPDVAVLQPAELRDVQGDGPFASDTRQRDFYGTQELTWTFTDAEAGVFWAWWTTDLLLGGRAFSAPFPHPDGAPEHVYKFLAPPRQEHLADSGVRRITTQACVRGASLLPGVGLPTLRVLPVTPTVSEGAGFARWAVSIRPTTIDAASVVLSLSSGGGVTIGSDVSANIQVSTDNGSTWSAGSPTPAVSLPAGSAGFQARVAITDDALFEAAETVTLNVDRTSGTFSASSASGSVTIIDNEAVGITVGSSAIVARGLDVPFQIDLTQAASTTVTANWATQDITATAGQDYVAASGSISIPPGQTSATVSVQTLLPATSQPEERLRIVLSNVVGASLVAGGAEGVLLAYTPGGVNPGTPPTVSVSDVTVIRGEAAVFTLTLSAPWGSNYVVNWSTLDGSALVNRDYVADSGALTFAIGQTSRTITIQTLLDPNRPTMPEETFVLRLQTATGAILDNTGVCTLPAYPAAGGALTWSISDATAGRGSGVRATLTVSLSADQPAPVTVQVQTQDGTALGLRDFRGRTFTLTIPAWTLSRQVQIETLMDDSRPLPLPDETFTVTLSNPSQGTIADGTGVVTLTGFPVGGTTPAPPPPAIEIWDTSQIRPTGPTGGGYTAVFTLYMWPAAAAPVTVDWTTVNGSAVAGTDFVAASGSVTFPAGISTRSVYVEILPVPEFTPSGSFTVTISNPSGAGAVIGLASASCFLPGT